MPAFADGAPNADNSIRVYSVEDGEYITVEKIDKSEEQWRKILSPEVYHITREKGTEPAFTGRYWNHHEHGVYTCVACGQDLFLSGNKYDSGSGWPSFDRPVAPENVATETDTSFFMVRTEVHCSRCGAHLGHVFPDGPKTTGERYCINSASLDFRPTTQKAD